MLFPKWIKRSSLRLSFVLAAIAWLLLVVIHTNSAENSTLRYATTTVLAPGFKAGRYLGAQLFSDNAVRGTTGWYVVPLFGIVGEFLLLFAVWYVLIRLKRAFQGEQETVPTDESRKRQRDKHVRSHFNGEVEPAFAPDDEYNRFSYLFHYERFKLGIWRQFRENTGSWPILSIGFHCCAVLGIFVSIAAFFSVREKQNWDDWLSFIIGATGAVAYVISVVTGEKIMRKLDWRLFGKRN